MRRNENNDKKGFKNSSSKKSEGNTRSDGRSNRTSAGRSSSSSSKSYGTKSEGSRFRSSESKNDSRDRPSSSRSRSDSNQKPFRKSSDSRDRPWNKDNDRERSRSQSSDFRGPRKFSSDDSRPESRGRPSSSRGWSDEGRKPYKRSDDSRDRPFSSRGRSDTNQKSFTKTRDDRPWSNDRDKVRTNSRDSGYRENSRFRSNESRSDSRTESRDRPSSSRGWSDEGKRPFKKSNDSRDRPWNKDGDKAKPRNQSYRSDEPKKFVPKSNWSSEKPQKSFSPRGREASRDFTSKPIKGKLPVNTLRISGEIATLNLTPGKSHLGETRIIINNNEYRLWDPKSSKLCAALHNGLNYPEIVERPIILYLGASFGNTVSYLSDIYPNGIIYAVESAIEPLRQLALLSLKRKNIVPIHEDANYPEKYMDAVPHADIIYMDVAQKNQVQILKKNLIYASESTVVMFCVKARSIDVTVPPREVFQKVREELTDSLKILHETKLEPFEKDHAFMTLKKK